MPAFVDVIADPYAHRRFIATLYPKNTAGVTQTKYVSDHGLTTSGSESPAHTHYEGRIKQGLDFERFLFERHKVEGRSIPSYGALVLANLDHELDDWDDLIFDEQRVVIELGAESSTRAEYGIVFDGTAVRAWVAEEVRIQLRDLQYKLDKPIARTVYRGMGSALLFNGTGNYADTNATTITPQATETFELWVRDFDLGGTTAFVLFHGSADNASNTNVKIARGSTGLFTATIARNSGSQVSIAATTPDVRKGPWAHVALVVAAGTNACKFYVNGELVGSATAPALTATAKVLTLGAVAGGASNRLGGMVDDVRYWSGVARTQDEIRSSMNRELEGNETGLLHYWRCNEGTGTTAANKVTGSTLALTLQAGASWGSSTEGSADIAGGKKPRAYGHPPNVKGKLVDAQKLIYQFSEGYTSRIKAVYDKGVALTAGTAYSRLYDFLVNTPAAGTYSTYLAEGLIRCGMQPAGDPTADLIGEAPGRWGVLLDGVNDEVTATLAPPAGSMTMEGWFYLNSGTALGTRRFAGWRNGAAAGARVFVLPQTDPSVLRFQLVNDAGTTFNIDTTVTVPYDRWFHLAGVVDVAGTQSRLYLNGCLVGSGAISGTFNTVTLTDLRIGRSQDLATYVPMSADDFRLWSVARTEAQIRETMFTRMVGTETGLYSCHQFDDATGTSAVNQVAAKTAMTLTGGVVWGGGYAPDTGALLSRWIAGERAGIADFSGMNLSSIYTVEASNSAAMQFLVTGNETCLDALDLLANSMGTYYGFDRAALFDMGLVELPKGDPVKELTEEVIKSIKPLEVPNPVWRQVVNYNRVWTVQSRDQLAGGVSSTRAELVAKGWRQAEQSSESIRLLYGDKEPLTLDTALVFKKDADALALLRLTRYGTKRKMYEVELKADGWDLDVSEVVGITFPDYGFAGGVNCRIIGMSENAATGYVRLFVWR